MAAKQKYGLPLESDSMEVVYCSPALQSFPAHELVPALRELRRVLKPGGLLRLCVPDFDRALQAYRSAGQSWRWCWDWDTQDGNFLTQLTNYGYARSLFTRDFVDELQPMLKDPSGPPPQLNLDIGGTSPSDPLAG